MVGYKLFLTEFYYNIKMKKKIYKINIITYNAYHILVVLFLGTFRIIIKTLKKSFGYNKLCTYIIGIILGLIILPLHIIINPFILFYVIKNYKNYKNKEKNYIRLLKEYIFYI